ncbi:sulfur carrier protein ThiS [Candidatus Pelagibacter sp.]|nr:sulfur carrier protein ThiS [Candidatus Pelagibacter sp.]
MKKINKVKIKINGKNFVIKPKMTLKEVITKYKIPEKKVAIELNEKIVNKEKIRKIKVKNLDKIEIVHFIGGG